MGENLHIVKYSTASDKERPNGIELSRRAGPYKTYPATRLPQMQEHRCFRAPEGAVGLSELLCGILTSNLVRFMGLSIGIPLCDEYQQVVYDPAH